MRNYNDSLLHSATDLNAFLGCPHAVALDLRKLCDPASLPDRADEDEGAKLVAETGVRHEADYLEQLQGVTDVAVIAGDGPLPSRVSATEAAMRSGANVIYQAAFLDPPWHGFADFLRRVEEPSALGSWSYEPVDTKLAREPRAKHLIQLALYADLMEPVQGLSPGKLHVVLGDGTERSFAARDFRHTLAQAKQRYLTFVEGGAAGTVPEPCSACSLCSWREVCAEEWERTDHLSRVAGLNRGQAKKLRDAGIATLTALAAAPAEKRVPKLAPMTFAKLRAQAVLQAKCAGTDPQVELLPLEEARGFLRMPAPDPADLFFDLEGDPLHPGGLEYLWGVHSRDEARAAQFRFLWSHDRGAERAAFEEMVDWFTAHVAENPRAHIYHYAAYEVHVLRRLSTAFASREDEVDGLLRAEKFVDLYAISRAAIRTSERNMSLKTLEHFFAEKREEDVKAAGESIVHYHRWRETQDRAILDGILAYNRVDCVNTEGLRDWLLSLRPEGLPWWEKETPPPPKPEKIAELDQMEAARAAARQAALASTHLSEPFRELCAQLVDFHKRAKKPALWAVFDRCGADDATLIDDLECIGGIAPFGVDWLRQEKRSVVARYSCVPQETKLKPGSAVLHAPTRMRLGSIVDLDIEAGWVEVKRGLKPGEAFPESGSIIAGWPLDDEVLQAGLRRTVLSLANGCGAQAMLDLLERRPPRLTDWDGGPLVRPDESLIDAATLRALAMDESLLFIQGPPGTGKTHTSAHVILALIATGKRVGVASNSHKAINNLLAKIEQVALAEGVRLSGVKKASNNDPDTFLNGQIIEDTTDNDYVESFPWKLIGGTAYLFAREEMTNKVDYLFVDEAGQVSLGNLAAMAGATRNIVLVGDQMQLAQPVQGAHPGESGLSALDYLLQGAATIAPDKGILLDESWRMHPSICGFISEAVYEGRLKPHPSCAEQRLVIAGGAGAALKSNGLSIVAMAHEGCSQSSHEEALAARDLLEQLIGAAFVGRHGKTSTLGLQNILIVAPYNAQVNLLKAYLPDGARVGTVDKFQGQEAEVVIVSLATSSPEDLPRHVDFFYSKNRLNVAISRARTLALVLMNPRLLELDAKSVEHLAMVNTLAWAKAHAEGDK
jgi:predicted RecB family nuclease